MPTTTINLTGQALSKADDTNVTLTLGGTPLTALLKATSLTLGWTGTLSVARGGTALGSLGTASQLIRVNAGGTALEYFTPTFGSGTVTSVAQSFTGGLISVAGSPITGSGTLALTVAGTSGGIPYFSSTTTWATSAALAASAIVIGGGAGAAPSTTTTGTGVLTALGTAVNGSGAISLTTSPTFVSPVLGAATGTSLDVTGALTSGVASSAAGTLILRNAANAFTQTIRGTNPVASITYDLPTTAPTAGQVLSSTAPSGAVATLSWASVSSGLTVGTTTISSGTSLRIPYNLAGVYQEQANFTIGSFAAGFLDVPRGYAKTGVHLISNQQSNTGLDGSNLYIGNTSQRTAGTLSVIIGDGSQTNGVDVSVLVGYGANFNNNAFTYSTLLGTYAGFTGGAYVGDIAIGYAASPTASHQGILGSNYANGYVDNWYFNGVTHTAAYSVTLNASGGSGTNNAGANFTVAAGKGTGTAAGGNLKLQTSAKLTTGTTLQTATDRHFIGAKYVDLTESSATTFGNLALTTSGTVSGGTIVYTVESNDGTDYQSLTGTASYSVVNKAGTLTYILGADTQSGTAASSGTLTGTLNLSASTTTLLFQMNAVSSLTQTTLRISFQVLNNFGVATITSA